MEAVWDDSPLISDEFGGKRCENLSKCIEVILIEMLIA